MTSITSIIYITKLLSKKQLIDDSLDVWAAHGMGGFTGALLTGIFAEKAINPLGANGVIFGNWNQLGVQAIAVCTTATFTVIGTWVLLTVLKRIMNLRVSKKEEEEGLDLSLHGEKGYYNS